MKGKTGNEEKARLAGIVDRDTLSHIRREKGEEEERSQAPLSFRVIRRLFRFAQPHRPLLMGTLAMVILRALQMPVLAWAVGAIVRGPIAQKDVPALVWWVAGFAAFALFTELTFHFRVRWAWQLGEVVIHDLREAMFRHWLRLNMGYFNTHAVGRLISRLTGDAENVRVGVQNVLFVSLVQAGQMIGCAAFMIWEDLTLFLVVLGMAPVVWLLNRFFRRRLSAAYRNQSDSFSRITATMAESVSGIRVTQSFSREGLNASQFKIWCGTTPRSIWSPPAPVAPFSPCLNSMVSSFSHCLSWLAAGGLCSPAPTCPWAVSSSSFSSPDCSSARSRCWATCSTKP